jgi:chemotaxis protein histidine kinase CheA
MNEEPLDCTKITDRNLITSLTSILGPKFEQTCGSFFNSLPGELEKILTASDSNKPQDVQRIAHSLKGASVMIGLTGIARILHLIEANSADSEQIGKLVSVDLNDCIAASKNCLSRLRN